jgi:hypothetical protein
LNSIAIIPNLGTGGHSGFGEIEGIFCPALLLFQIEGATG